MTEAEWLSCDDPERMLRLLRGQFRKSHSKSGRRKLRLFACASCRRIAHLLLDSRSLRAVEVAERFADGDATQEELKVAGRGAWRVLAEMQPRNFTSEQLANSSLAARIMAARCAAHASERSRARDWLLAGEMAVSAAVQEQFPPQDWTPLTENDRLTAYREQGLLVCAVVRDVFGYPLRYCSCDSNWLSLNGGTIAQLAQAIYAERRFTDLPILADALEEAGCADAAILAHCRSGGEHVRGCWVVDLILGKS